MSLSIQVDSKKRKGGFVKMGIKYHHCICLFFHFSMQQGH
jgi:hypothetical protein